MRVRAAPHLVRVVVELEVGEHEPGRFRRRCCAGAAQHRAHAGDELLEAERLGDVVVAADREALDLLLGGVARGQEHDRHVVPVGAQPLHDREAVAVGEHDVEHDEVGAERLGRPQGVGAGAGDLDVEAFVAQGGRDEIGDVRLVVDDEDSVSATRGWSRAFLWGCCAIPVWSAGRFPKENSGSCQQRRRS